MKKSVRQGNISIRRRSGDDLLELEIRFPAALEKKSILDPWRLWLITLQNYPVRPTKRKTPPPAVGMNLAVEDALDLLNALNRMFGLWEKEKKPPNKNGENVK